MPFRLLFTQEAENQLKKLEDNAHLEKRLKAVKKALAYLEHNPKHPGLKTHKHTLLSKQYGKEIFAAYAENNTPAAYRIFWYYGPEKKSHNNYFNYSAPIG